MVYNLDSGFRRNDEFGMTRSAITGIILAGGQGRRMGNVDKGLQLRTDRPEITVAAGEVAEVPVRLQADPASLTQRSTPVYFRLQAVDTEDLATEQGARFLGPTP